MRWCRSAERAVHAVRVVIISKIAQLAPELERVPEEHAIEKFTPKRADQSFNERMRNRGIWNRLDLVLGELLFQADIGS